MQATLKFAARAAQHPSVPYIVTALAAVSLFGMGFFAGALSSGLDAIAAGLPAPL